MDLSISKHKAETVLGFSGVLDGEIDPELDRRIRSLIKSGARFRFDLTGVQDLRPAGLRWARMLFRQIHGEGGHAQVCGLAPQWRDALDAVGMLHYPLPKADRDLDGVAPDRPLAEQTIDLVPTHFHEGYALMPGPPYPFGAWPMKGGLNFSIYSRDATACTLVLFERSAKEPMVEIPFPPEFRVGHVFAMTILELDTDDYEYGFRLEGPFDPGKGLRFDASRVLLDPYARGISGQPEWGQPRPEQEAFSYRGFVPASDFEWEGDRPLEIAPPDLLIYEMHVRGFTRHESSGVRFPGTYAAIRDKIPYLKELGINAVELMPIFEFNELENTRTNPATGERLFNYWGYSTVGFGSPKVALAATGRLGMQVDEFKSLVKELHRAGIAVILDVVYNHTAEGNEHGPTISFRGVDNRTYYMLTPGGHYQNFSGCGNTLNCNNPCVRDFIVDSLRYWVAEYHVDGFRFDLASILSRDPQGMPLANPPLLESLALDPVLGRTLLIAEAWDAGGLYQVGTFPDYGRWGEWNGKYRDCARKFLKGEPGLVGEMAQRMIGSPDLYSDSGPMASVNFITAHDGFTLADLVSYNDKHNEANGEQNRDGTNDNYTWNCGVEGPTTDPKITRLRDQQSRNALAYLLLSQGVPMLLMGDEVGRTQQGNNNTYCHDSPLNWLDWSLVEKNAALFRFCRLMIRLRKAHPALRFPSHTGTMAADGSFLDVTWHGTAPWHADWSADSRVLAMMLRRYGGEQPEDIVYIAINTYWDGLFFGPPEPPDGSRWHVAVNTGMSAPEEIWEIGQEPLLEEQSFMIVGGRSVVVLVAKPVIRV